VNVLTLTHSRSRSGFALGWATWNFDGSHDVRIRTAQDLYRVVHQFLLKRLGQ